MPFAQASDNAVLVQNYDGWIAALNAGYQKISAAWSTKFPAQASAFSADLGSLNSRWSSAQTAAYPVAGYNDPSVIDESAKFTALVQAIRNGPEGNAQDPSSFAALRDRLYSAETLLGAPHTAYVPAQQPPRNLYDELSVIKPPSAFGAGFAAGGITTVLLGVGGLFILYKVSEMIPKRRSA
jgi:hypothetical protein